MSRVVLILVLVAPLAVSPAGHAVATSRVERSAVAEAPPESPPLPPRRPDRPEPAAPPAATGSVEPPSAGPETLRPNQAAGEEASCLARLKDLHVVFETRAPIKNGACGAAAPVVVSKLPGGVAVDPPATVTCPVAEALARWTADALIKEADRHLGAAPTRLVIGTSYECRNQRSGAKLSEHAFANGVDVMGVEVWKRPAVTIRFQKEGTEELGFQNAIRAKACPHFTTVLGPGSDAAHADHLHLDLRGRKAGYRICQ